MQSSARRTEPFGSVAKALEQASANQKSRVEQYGKVNAEALSCLPQARDCAPGVIPKEYNIIVAPPVFPERMGNSPIYIPQETRERMEMAMQIVRIVAASPLAFNYDAYPEGEAPKVGDAVWIARYAGGEFEGRDNRVYRIIKDKDVGAVIEEARD